MRSRLWNTVAAAYLALGLAPDLVGAASDVAAPKPIRALILTSPGIYHDQQAQSETLAKSIGSRANVAFDASLHELDRWKSTDFSDGYDVLVYLICAADETDPQLIANLRRQTEAKGVPAVFIHCAMHSFRETDAWWPVVGLRTKHHEQQHPMRQAKGEAHAILAKVPDEWTVEMDELYVNLRFEGSPLLTSPGEDGEDHATAWLHQVGETPVFGTTLGHNDATFDDPAFQELITAGLLHVTGKLAADGKPMPGYEAAPNPSTAIANLSAGKGASYLTDRDCTESAMRSAIGPCYLGCILHPFKWGDTAAACRKACFSDLSIEALMLECGEGA